MAGAGAQTVEDAANEGILESLRDDWSVGDRISANWLNHSKFE